MKGRIVFWFNLLPPNFNTGIVTIKLFGQKCETCKIEVYEQPMWYPEEVTKVIFQFFSVFFLVAVFVLTNNNLDLRY